MLIGENNMPYSLNMDIDKILEGDALLDFTGPLARAQYYIETDTVENATLDINF